ncbi:MT-A70 family methyltransferase, partial [Rhodoplanes roseus]
MTLEFHPLADLFPLMEGGDFDELVADVAAHGLRQPIDIWQGKILDGRNRYRAALAAGIEIGPHNTRHFRPELYGDPLAYVISLNLPRRHMNESQRAFVAAKIATLRHGGDRRSEDQAANLPVETTQAEAAARLNVSERSVRAAKVVQERGAPELQRAVETGKLSISQAAIAARMRRDLQAEVAAEASAGRANVVRSMIKREARAEREADLGARQVALPDRRYGVILADPEWRFEVWSRDTGLDRAADNHYPTSCTEVIAARDVSSIAADDCVLFLWATIPMLPHALLVMAAWGFDYVSHQVWAKDQAGTGYWFRQAHELVLVGKRGKPPAPAMGANDVSLFRAPRAEHSAKPDRVAEMIERWFPTLPKIELNRRGPARPGWDAWGNEAEPEEATGEIIAGDDDVIECGGCAPPVVASSRPEPTAYPAGAKDESAGSACEDEPDDVTQRADPRTSSEDGPQAQGAGPGAARR